MVKMRENPFTLVTDGSNDTGMILTTTSNLYVCICHDLSLSCLVFWCSGCLSVFFRV